MHVEKRSLLPLQVRCSSAVPTTPKFQSDIGTFSFLDKTKPTRCGEDGTDVDVI